MAFITNPKILVALCVYGRDPNLLRWLTAWKSCQKFDAKLVVINNYDGDAPKPKFKTIFDDILGKDTKDIYVARKNIGQDMGAFQDICYGRLTPITHDITNENWDILYWTADDCIPLKKNFLIYFIDKVMSDGVGICGPHISNEHQRHVRTNCFCLKREVAQRLTFPKDVMENRDDCYDFEHRKNTLTNQIEAMGLKAVMPTNNEHEISYATWDIGHFPHLNLWEQFWAEFPECREMGLRQ